MHVQESVELNESLREMWETHREYLRRMLIGLTRDIDLADDLLQETYLRARAGIPGFRDGDPRAWLSTIARNAFLMHVRRPYVRLETPLDEDTPSAAPDSADRLIVIELRRAVGALSPGLRSALIMKHYGGFTYKEIADRLNCVPSTAKWRVRTALEQLRVALGELREEHAEMKCDELKGLRILDYLYGTLSGEKAADVERHLEECAVCCREAEELRQVVIALEPLEGDLKMMNIDELDATGAPTVYGSISGVNESTRPTESLDFESDKTCSIDYLSALGEELEFEKTQSELSEYRFHYRAHLPRPVQPGETMDMLAVCHVAEEMNAVRLEKGRWRYHRRHTPSNEQEFVFVQAIRLPCGARLLTAEPKPDEIRTNGTTTLVWRRLLAPNEQFESTVEYTQAGA